MFFIRRFDPEIHHRQSIRLKRWDYSSPGSYFITICAIDRGNFFGVVHNGEMILNTFGVIVHDAWFDLAKYHPHVTLDEFVVMPNHIHGILIINDARYVGAGPRPAPGECDPQPSNVGAGPRPAPGECDPQPPNVGADPQPAPGECDPQPPTGAGHGPAPAEPVTTYHALPEIIRQLKTFSAQRINILRGGTGKPVWQRNYYERIIRSENGLDRVRQYIRQNPKKFS